MSAVSRYLKEVWGLALRQGGASGFLGNFLHGNTANRNYTFPDKTGTVALLDDLGPQPVISIIGDGTNLQYDIYHGFSTDDLIVQVWENSSLKREVFCEKQKPNVNNIRLIFASAPASNSLKVIIYPAKATSLSSSNSMVIRLNPSITSFSDNASTGFNGYTIAHKIPGASLSVKGSFTGAIIRWRISGSNAAAVTTAVIRRTIAGSNTFTDTETLKVNGNPITSLPVGNTDFDPIAMAFDNEHDYYILVYLSATGNTSTSIPQISTTAPCAGNYINGDKTATADASTIGVTGTGAFCLVGIYASASQSQNSPAADAFSSLINTETSISGATTLTHGVMYACTATSSDYIVTLPNVSLSAKKIVAIRITSTSTKLVTIDAGSGVTIDGIQTRVLWANEVAILYSNGTTWTKIGGKTIPMTASIMMNANQSVTANVWTNVAWDTLYPGTPGNYPPAMVELANNRMVIQRTGSYDVDAFMIYGANASVNNQWFSININSTGSADFQNGTSGVVTQRRAKCFCKATKGDTATVLAFYNTGSLNLLGNTGLGANINYFTIKEIPSW